MGKPPETKNSKAPSPPNQATVSTIEGEIERQIAPLIPQSQRGEVVSRVVAVLRNEKFSGPIAHPRHLREYEDILPGAAERIIAMAEREQQHNADIEGMIIHAEIDDRKRGMRFGLAAFGLLVILGFVAGMWGNNVLAGMLLASGFIGAAGVFINGRLSKKDD